MPMKVAPADFIRLLASPPVAGKLVRFPASVANMSTPEREFMSGGMS
jgi:hypothetical protein